MLSYIDGRNTWIQKLCWVIRLYHWILSSNAKQILLSLCSPHVRFRWGFPDLEVTSSPVQRDGSDRGCFYEITHKHVSSLICLFLFCLQEPCPPPLSDTMTPEEVWLWRKEDGFAWFYRNVCLIIYSMVIKYSHTCVESPNLESKNGLKTSAPESKKTR